MKRALPWILLMQLLVCVAVLLYMGPLVQDQSYHAFADQRTLLGIPNFWNVISNLPFAFVGWLGLRSARGLAARLLFAGVLLTAFGSAYYHWAPDDRRLVWDRLPMTVVFMSLIAILMRQRFPWAKQVVIPLVLIGTASVVWWQYSGDLRFYAFVQFAPIVVILTALLIGPLESGGGWIWGVLVFYAFAKVVELGDAAVYAHFPLSGHTLKHLLAATATWFLTRMQPHYTK